MRPLLAAVQGAFLAQLAAWLLYGELLPDAEEFFVCRSDDGDADAAESDDTAASPEAGYQSDGGGGGGGEGYGAWWSYTLRVACKPRLLSVRTAEASLFVGKVVRVLSPLAERDPASAAGEAANTGLAGVPGADITEAQATRYGVGVARGEGVEEAKEAEGAEPPAARQLQWRLRELATELHALQAALPLDAAGARVLESTLDGLQRQASSLLWRHLVTECNLRGLLRALKDYFLLGRGEVQHALALHPLVVPCPSPRHTPILCYIPLPGVARAGGRAAPSLGRAAAAAPRPAGSLAARRHRRAD